MANEALGRGKVKIFLEKAFKRSFLKIYLLGTLTGCILSLGAIKSSASLLLVGLVFGLGLIFIVFKS